MKTNKLALLFLLFSCVLRVQSQSVAEDLQLGVQEYNALRTYFDEIPVKDRSMEHVQVVKTRSDKAIALLTKARNEGTSEQIRAANYFIANARYQYGYCLGALGKNADSYQVMKSIEESMNSYAESSFPIRYDFFGKSYVIKWENFASTQAEFLTSMAEICLNLSKSDESLKFAKKAVVHPSNTLWTKYIVLTKITELVNKTPEKFTSVEVADYALQSAKSYDALSEKEKEIVKEQNYPKLQRNINQLLAESKKPNASTQVTEKCLEAAVILAKHEPTDARILELYDLAFKSKTSFTTSQAKTAETQARSFKASNKIVAERVALSAIDVIAKNISSTSCSEYDQVAALYKEWMQPTQVTKYQNMAKTCNDNRLKEQKRQAKASKRANRQFNVYAGAYVLPLIVKPKYRDFGLALNLAGKKTIVEFSYMIVNQNRTNTFDLNVQDHSEADQDDLTRWDGFYAHIQPKWMVGESQGYFGLLLGYADKTFEPMTNIPATLVTTGSFVPLSFSPTEKQYILMPNFGGIILGKGFGMDVYMGIGAAYTQFEHGGTIDRLDYDIQNTILEYRKDSYFSLIGRVGMTMGINFGKGNFN